MDTCIENADAAMEFLDHMKIESHLRALLRN